MDPLLQPWASRSIQDKRIEGPEEGKSEVVSRGSRSCCANWALSRSPELHLQRRDRRKAAASPAPGGATGRCPSRSTAPEQRSPLRLRSVGLGRSPRGWVRGCRDAGTPACHCSRVSHRGAIWECGPFTAWCEVGYVTPDTAHPTPVFNALRTACVTNTTQRRQSWLCSWGGERAGPVPNGNSLSLYLTFNFNRRHQPYAQSRRTVQPAVSAPPGDSEAAFPETWVLEPGTSFLPLPSRRWCCA